MILLVMRVQCNGKLHSNKGVSTSGLFTFMVGRDGSMGFAGSFWILYSGSVYYRHVLVYPCALFYMLLYSID